MIRLILDRSSFSRFDDLSEKLLVLIKNKRASVWVTPMLLSETAEMMLKQSYVDEARRHLKFILQISEERWFQDNFEIFRSELGIWPRRNDYYFLKSLDEASWKKTMAALANGGNFTSVATKEIADGNALNRGKMKRLRKTGIEMRLEIAEKVRQINRSTKDIRETWNDFVSKSLVKFGIDMLIKHKYYTKFLSCISVQRWEKNPDAFPFFKDWISGMLYIQYYAMRHQNDPLDQNAQSDIQHLLFFRMADGIVSEEKKFMKSAWQELYAPQGKQYYSVADLDSL